jgi:hypothetical protein
MANEYVAFNAIDGAIRRTKDLLWPFRKGVWLRLAVVAFFLGGLSFPNFYQFGSGDMGTGDMTGAITPDILGMILLIVGAVIILALVFGIISSIIQFVFVDLLRTEQFRILDHFGPRAGKGLRLFCFTFALVILLIVLIMIPIAFLAIAGSAMSGTNFFPYILGFILLILVLIIPFAIIMTFTTDFVVPIMIQDDCGVIAGWKTLLATFSGRWLQGLLYLLAKFILGLVAGIIQLIILAVAGLIIVLPFVAIGLMALSSLDLMSILLLAIPFLIIFIPVAMIVAVPFITFFRYYSLEVLGMLDERLAMLPANTPEND